MGKKIKRVACACPDCPSGCGAECDCGTVFSKDDMKDIAEYLLDNAVHTPPEIAAAIEEAFWDF